MNPPPTIGSDFTGEELSSERFARVLPAIMAVPREEVKLLSLDAVSAAIAVIGCLPAIRALWPQVVEDLPIYDAGYLDKLEDYAWATNCAHIGNITQVRDSDGLPALYDEAVALRSVLHSDMNMVITHGLIRPETMRQYSGQAGYKIVAYDLQVLSTVFTRHWARIQGKCAVQPGELVHADKLAARILRLATLRDHAPKTLTAQAEMQARAMTLLARCYDQVRRAVHFIRWKQRDADDIAPSLYAGRKHKPRAVSDVRLAQPAQPIKPGAETTPGNSATAMHGLRVPVPGSDPFMT